MKKSMTKKETLEKIKIFFQKNKFSPEDIEKIKRLGMKYNIKLGVYRKLFCKKCLSKLKGKVKVNKSYKSVECANCGYKNRTKL